MDIFAFGENPALRPRVLRRLASILVSRATLVASDTHCPARARRQKQLSTVFVLLTRHFDQKITDSPCGCLLFFLFGGVVRTRTCYRASHDGEFAYPTRSSESLLSRRRVWIYSPLAKIPPYGREFSDGSQDMKFTARPIS